MYKKSCYQLLFEDRVKQHIPETLSLVFGGATLTYNQLNEKANQLAHHLRRQGLGPEKLAGICLERSPDMIVAILAVLKAGGAYVPLDPAYPAERLAFMLQDARVSVLITETETQAALPPYDALTVCPDAERPIIEQYPTDNLPVDVSPDNAAYVIYTSGSSGRPKGAVITHRNLLQFVDIVPQRLDVTAQDVYLQSASITYAVSVRQIMVALAQGASLVIANSADMRDPLSLFKLIKEQSVTMMDVVPSFWRACVDALAALDESERACLLNNKLRQIVCVGEPLGNDLPESWAMTFKHPARLVNIFGQTETTGVVAAYPIPAERQTRVGVVPVGRPMPETAVHLLDQQLEPSAPGEAGEITLASDCVMRGYLNQPALTAEKLMPNPFSDEPGARLYRTGDLGQYNEEGVIEFLGRKDFQVQVRGMRVELGEVVGLLRRHPAVQEAVVLARKNRLDDQQLVAYFVLSQPLAQPSVVLRRYLKEQLPAHMVPAVYVALATLPLNPNGKVDRKALPPPTLAQHTSPYLLTKEPELANWFYRPQWEAAPPLEKTAEDAMQAGRWLLFVNAFSQPLAAHLREQGCSVVQVMAGAEFGVQDCGTITINPARRQDYDALLSHLNLSEQPISRVIHAWNSGPENYGTDGFYSLLGLMQTVAEATRPNPLQLLTLSSNAQAAVGSDIYYPERGLALGLCQVIPLEYPHLDCRMLDLDVSLDTAVLPNSLIEPIVAEFSVPTNLPPVAYRQGQRWIQRFRPAPLEAAARGQIKLRKGGVYLITGGLGGIGLALARYLAQTVQARLVLIGRSAFPEPEDWAAWLAAHDENNSTSRRIRQLQAVESLGGQAATIQADVTNANDMGRVLSEIQRRYGQLNGVVHAAGVANAFNLMRDMDWQAAEKVLAPKALGTQLLAQAVSGQPLDFFLVCSSLSATLGRLGQGDYCAANAFQDAFAHFAARQGLPAIAVNWDTWENLGMAAGLIVSPEARSFLQDRYLESGITAAEGAAVFERILTQSEPQIIISTRDLSARLAQKNSVLSGQSALRGPRPNLETPFVAPRSKLERELASVWAELLEIEAVGVHDDFFDLGGHSLLVVKAFAAIEAAYGYKFPLDVLFQARTIAALVELIQEKEQAERPSVLVPIRAEGSRPPLFCVHGVGGHALRFNKLAKALPAEQPVYGLTSVGVDGQRETLKTIEEMASYYIEAIRTVSPRGPYLLAGHSFGGFVALEMACRLQEAGEEVALLALFETAATQSPNYLPSLSFGERLTYYARQIGKRPALMAAKLRSWRDKSKRLAELPSYLRRPLHFQANTAEAWGLNAPESEPALRRVIEDNTAALQRYVPRRYAGRITLFKSLDHGIGRYYGWSEIARNGVAAYRIPGNHVGLLQPPGVDKLAQQLDVAIIKTLQQAPLQEKEALPLPFKKQLVGE